MKLVKPSFEIWSQQAGLKGIYKQIERAARVCYKSEHLTKEDSAKKMVDRLINSKHLSCLEHGTIYLKITERDVWDGFGDNWVRDTYGENPYSAVTLQNNDYLITTNYRVLVENGWLDDLKYLCEPTEYHEKRHTVKFILDRSTAQEFTRHRTMSFAMESQRYCAYNKDRFGNEITFCIPCWTSLQEGIYNNTLFIIRQTPIDGYGVGEEKLMTSLLNSEKDYFQLLDKGWKPEQARAVLPNATKTELVMTGFASDWKHFCSLRALDSTGKAHPSAKELALPLYNEFKERKWI